MKKPIYICAISLILSLPLCLFAQEENLEDLQLGIETAGKLLADIPVTHFEDADTWKSSMSVDQGIIVSMKRRGRPLEVPEIDPYDGTENENVLGVKVAYTQRGYKYFRMGPPRPIKIPGITKALSTWVCGRSFQHRLYAHVLDYEGNEMILDMGLLDFVGWKKVNIIIPSSVKQHNYHDTDWRGISFTGFSIATDPSESYGVYYVYFDELRAITDIYSEEFRDEDDMEDGW
ncbi:MAG: hypothetical protein AMS17_15910 [Spirochaetes bacterium DG_61]|nr:MAG: hypothetical protein AMS17_15910 [Spirochaetes bacterium DG_61]